MTHAMLSTAVLTSRVYLGATCMLPLSDVQYVCANDDLCLIASTDKAQQCRDFTLATGASTNNRY
jgi:hypothetical protein